MINKFETPYGTFILDRDIDENNRSLQAWSSADLYILDTLKDYDIPEKSQILIMNDAYGALTAALSGQFSIYHYNDSYCSEKECRKNLENNKISADLIRFIHPDEKLPENISLVIMKNPKSLNYLEYQLQLVAEQIPEGVDVLAADMSKNIHSSTVALYEHYLNNAKTSLAWKKSRLVQGKTDGKKEAINQFPVEYTPLNEPYKIINYPNLFAHGRLDPGTAFLVDNFPFVANHKHVVDLACGDGILALKAASKWPEAEILCVDESWLAVKSAKESLLKSSYTNRVDFKVTDVLEGVDKEWADLVLCNPPFHSNYSISTATALKMFRESAQVLKERGELFVVANRHLGYENQLSKIFSKAQVIKSNKKFSIIRAVK
ncbi:MAG: methyltransferase [Spirochaetaceae bacterium]|nr:methyltransferase [Spirochaetaceae bacterium]